MPLSDTWQLNRDVEDRAFKLAYWLRIYAVTHYFFYKIISYGI